MTPSSQVYGTQTPATMTATVELGRGGEPEGSVRFETENGVIGTAPVTDGVATLDLPADLPAGAHQLTASFVPEDTGAAHGSTSDPVAFTVDEGDVDDRRHGDQLRRPRARAARRRYLLSMVATVALETGRAPVGTVQFSVDGQVVDSDAVSGGKADATVTVTKGTHTVVADLRPGGPGQPRRVDQRPGDGPGQVAAHRTEAPRATALRGEPRRRCRVLAWSRGDPPGRSGDG